MRSRPEFIPQMTRDELVQCASSYPIADDDDALSAGAAIASGDFSRNNLLRIYIWKTNGRGRSRLEWNSDEEIHDSLRLAVNAATARSAIAVLNGLSGVDTPVASAIMTVIRQESFTILDYRALEALGIKATDRSIPFYLDYLGYCVDLAKRWELPLRTLDRGLWEWSKQRAGG